MGSFKNNVINFVSRKNKKNNSGKTCEVTDLIHEAMDECGIDRRRLKTTSVDKCLKEGVSPNNSEFYRTLMRFKNRSR